MEEVISNELFELYQKLREDLEVKGVKMPDPLSALSTLEEALDAWQNDSDRWDKIQKLAIAMKPYSGKLIWAMKAIIDDAFDGWVDRAWPDVPEDQVVEFHTQRKYQYQLLIEAWFVLTDSAQELKALMDFHRQISENYDAQIEAISQINKNN